MSAVSRVSLNYASLYIFFYTQTKNLHITRTLGRQHNKTCFSSDQNWNTNFETRTWQRTLFKSQQETQIKRAEIEQYSQCSQRLGNW